VRGPQGRRTVRLVHFSDYHAHAVPFYAEGQHGAAGIARLIAYLREVRPDAVVTNGGDLFNVGSPAWSDRYQGREWPWFNGLVDAMALGNHDSDYGPEVFRRNRRSLDHPILCANLVDARGDEVLTTQGRPYAVREVDGIRIGLLAAAGPDLDALVLPEARPVPGARFLDRIPVVERLVARMRREDGVHAVVLFGHALHQDDVALARAVPGIDVVLGTHSHRREDLTTIAGTDTVTVSPFQYGTYVADLRLAFRGGALLDVTGGLVRMTPDRPQAPDIATKVARLQHELAVDPAYAHLREEVGHAEVAVSPDGSDEGDSALGNLVADVMREATGSEVALLSSSALREAIPPGTVRVDDVVTALPYPNQLVVVRCPGRTLRALLEVSRGHRGTNFHAQVSGLRFRVTPDGVGDVVIEERDGTWRPLDPDRRYLVATNDFTADVVPGYREHLAGLARRATGLELRETLLDRIRRTGHAGGTVDGRIGDATVPRSLGPAGPGGARSVSDPGGSPEGAASAVEPDWSRALPYVPRTLVDALERRGGDTDGWVEPLEGTLVVADISGFTPLSEGLAASGTEGAERLTTIINGYFERLLDVAASLGGDNLKFGGDALLLAFRGDRHADRAVAAALRMQRATQDFPAIRLGRQHQRLAMSVGVHTATFWFAAAGNEHRRQHLLFGGEAARLAATEGAAERGEVVVTDATAEALTDATLETVDGRLVVRRMPPVDHDAALPPALGTEVARALLPYLPPIVADNVRAGVDPVAPGDHRRVAVVFVGVRGLNEHADEAGPEAAFAELEVELATVLGLLDRHHGYLAGNDIDPKGTKLICLFGAPVAAEDDAAAALRFTADLLDAWHGRGSPLRHQIGVNVGSVFAGDAGSWHRRDYTILGDHVNLAARLMGKADPGSAAVAAWVESPAAPALTPADPVLLKGKSQPVPIGRLYPGARRPDDVERLGTSAPPLCGREGELDRIATSLDRTEAGAGGRLHLVGDAGIGKSALVEAALRERLDWRVLEGRCYAYTTALPFSCWIPVLRSLLAVGGVAAADERLVRARRSLASLVPDRVDELGLLAELLGLEDATAARWRGLAGDARRALTFSLITDVVVASAARPLALVLEDVQWADTSSLELLDHLAPELAGTRVAVVTTARPGGADHGDGAELVLELGPLPRAAVAELLHHLVGLRATTLVDTVWEKTAGNPLYATELTQLLADRAAGRDDDLDAEALPDRVQGLLMSRLDTLPPPQRLALTGASVLGSEFSRTALEELLDRDDVASALDALVRERLLRATAGDRYVFSQNLLQDVAYHSLRFSRRRELHRRAAAAIERRSAADLEPHLADLARHHRHGGDPRRTIRYAVAAGDRARRVHAYHEALTSYRHALAAVDSLRGDRLGGVRSVVRERIADSLDLLGDHREAADVYRAALRGWRASAAVPEDLADVVAGVEVAARPAVLCRKIAWACSNTQIEYEEAGRWLDAAERALPETGHEPLRGAIEVARATVGFRIGRYEESVEHGRRGIELSADAGPQQRADAHEALARPLLELGHLEAANLHRRAALAIRESLGDLVGLMIAHNNLGSAEQLLGNLDAAREHYEESRQAAARLRRAPSVAIVENNIGELLLLQGRPEEAVDHLDACIDAFGGNGAVAGLALVNLARARLALGELEGAREALEAGIVQLEAVGASGLLAEALVERAEVSRAAGDLDLAVEQAERAREGAEELGMQLVAARAHLVLGCSLLEQGAVDRARAHLLASRELAVAAGADGQLEEAERVLASLSPAPS
jgi:5'-nucleotidase / UDP-sugar diphosphatase